MKKLLSRIVAVGIMCAPGIALAAYNDVTLTSSAVLSVGGATVSVSGDSNAVETIVVSASTFDITTQSGSTLTVTAPDLAVTAMTASQSTSNSCSGGVKTLTVNASSASTITIRPSATACTTASTASSGGGGTVSGLISGGGGGGGASTPASTPVTTPASTILTAPAAPAPAMSSGSFTRDLEVGATGDDVRQLQVFLNTHGFIVTESGGGSPGLETSKFGGLTRAALAKFQAANGITPAVGYFGPKTRASVNAMTGN